MSTSEFREAFDSIQLSEHKLHQFYNLRRIRNSLKVVGIGFFLYKSLDAKIAATQKEKQILLETLIKKASDYLDYFKTQSEIVRQSNNYLDKDNEIRLLGLLDNFENDLRYLVSQSDFAVQPAGLFNSIGELRKFIATYNFEFEKAKKKAELLALKSEVLQATAEFDLLFFGKNYFSKKQFYHWKNKWLKLKIETENCVKIIGFDFDFKEKLTRLLDAYQKVGLLETRNRDFVRQETEKYQVYLDTVESNPLTIEQKTAVVTDEENVLVVAGAGTGKTSTIVGKAGYLLEKGLARPDEILLLSFNKDVQLELENRISSKLDTSLVAKTYHSFGLGVVAQATGRQPSVSKLAEDKTKFNEKIFEFIKNRMHEPSFAKIVNSYFLYYLVPYKSQFDFASFGDYVRYMKQYDLRSLKGDRVKSFEECYIANFLFVNGIEYVYEPDYEVNTATGNNRQYKPDFYLPKYKIYIEHFGINRHGNPAPFISRDDYTRHMFWKKSVHAQNKTVLIETFSYEQKEGQLLINLERKLRDRGVKFFPIPEDKIFKNLNDLGKTSQLPEIVCTFLNLYKASGKTIQQIERELDHSDFRTKVFLKIFSAVYDDYTSYLRALCEIDFNDMLNDATNFILDQKYVSNFKYILVDEFQDISQSRYLFLKALAEQNQSKLFCVGDDWQSIYRFTGSDISLMVDFKKNFGFSECLFLQQTFRFNKKICDFSSQFILQNPLQIKKSIMSKYVDNLPAVCVVRANTVVALRDILLNLSKKSERPESVFVIGRYNYLQEEYLKDIPRKMGNLGIEFVTAHSSKGLEADYVVLVGLSGGKLGFPCQIADDPVLNLVLAKGDPFPNAEERRLFYVAVTRAKKRVYLIDDPGFNSSAFTLEILNGKYEVESIGQLPKTHLCPVCETGELVKKQSVHGLFYSCSNYPYCNYIPKQCPRCGDGFLRRRKNDFACSNMVCSFQADVCPECNDGYLVRRTSRNGGFFYGCSNYPGCRYIKRSYSSKNYRRY